MKETMYRKLVGIIHSCRSWVDVHQADHEGTQMVRIAGELRPIRCRMVTLVATRPNGIYPKGHVWDIPEYRLDKAVLALKRKPAFRERWNRETLSAEDAEAIIERASFGFIHLHLEEQEP